MLFTICIIFIRPLPILEMTLEGNTLCHCHVAAETPRELLHAAGHYWLFRFPRFCREHSLLFAWISPRVPLSTAVCFTGQISLGWEMFWNAFSEQRTMIVGLDCLIKEHNLMSCNRFPMTLSVVELEKPKAALPPLTRGTKFPISHQELLSLLVSRGAWNYSKIKEWYKQMRMSIHRFWAEEWFHFPLRMTKK